VETAVTARDAAFSIRPATHDDYDAFVTLFPELHVDDPIPLRDEWAAGMLPGMLVAEHEGEVAGYSWSKVFGEEAYVFNVVVSPRHRGRGAGRAIMAGIAERSRAEGAKRWSLNVRIANDHAIRLYERFGLARTYRSTGVMMPWERVAALPRDEGRVEARIIEPDEDATLESAFGLIPGRLAHHRSYGRVLIVLGEPAEAVGLAAFDPGFPGAFPFQVTRPGLAAQLLDAMRPHARPGDAVVKLMIERDAPLTDVLRAAGAEVRIELFHMEGSLVRES
jgi:ribosomal protein S18 acetylase RimI-like enzyme